MDAKINGSADDAGPLAAYRRTGQQATKEAPP